MLTLASMEDPENQKVYVEQSQDFAPTIVSDSPLWEGTSLAKDVIQQQLLLQRGKRKALKTKISPLLSLFSLLCTLHKMWVGCLTVAISIIFIHWTLLDALLRILCHQWTKVTALISNFCSKLCPVKNRGEVKTDGGMSSDGITWLPPGSWIEKNLPSLSCVSWRSCKISLPFNVAASKSPS